MQDLNRVALVGRLGRDPELRQTPSGASVCDIRVAVNGREKRGEEWVDRVDWITVTCWGRTAENVEKFLSKGRQVAVEGRLRYEEWEKDGQKRNTLKVVATNVQFTGKREEDGGGAGDASNANQSSVPV